MALPTLTLQQKKYVGKTLNSGQTCIAPDFAIIQEDSMQEFIEGFKKACEKFYDPDQKGIAESKDYGRIINDSNFERLKHFRRREERGAKIEFGGEVNKEER